MREKTIVSQTSWGNTGNDKWEKKILTSQWKIQAEDKGRQYNTLTGTWLLFFVNRFREF